MKEKKNENIPYTNDFMFSLVMSNAEICIDFLHMILPEEDFGEIRLMKSDNPLLTDQIMTVQPQHTMKFAADAHGVRFDAYAKSRNVWTEIEMQTYKGTHIGKRARYYQANMDLEALQQGRPYKELPRSYVIFICTYDYIGADDPRIFSDRGTKKG